MCPYKNLLQNIKRFLPGVQGILFLTISLFSFLSSEIWSFFRRFPVENELIFLYEKFSLRISVNFLSEFFQDDPRVPSQKMLPYSTGSRYAVCPPRKPLSIDLLEKTSGSYQWRKVSMRSIDCLKCSIVLFTKNSIE